MFSAIIVACYEDHKQIELLRMCLMFVGFLMGGWWSLGASDLNTLAIILGGPHPSLVRLQGLSLPSSVSADRH